MVSVGVRPTAMEQQALTQRPGTTVPLKLKDQKPNVALQEDRAKGESDSFIARSRCCVSSTAVPTRERRYSSVISCGTFH